MGCGCGEPVTTKKTGNKSAKPAAKPKVEVPPLEREILENMTTEPEPDGRRTGGDEQDRPEGGKPGEIPYLPKGARAEEQHYHLEHP
jgi:hypothetical protein